MLLLSFSVFSSIYAHDIDDEYHSNNALLCIRRERRDSPNN